MMQNAALIHMGYPRKYHEAGRWHQSLQLEGLLTGVTINTSVTSLRSRKFQLRNFSGERCELFSDVISSEVGD